MAQIHFAFVNFIFSHYEIGSKGGALGEGGSLLLRL